MTDQPQRLDLDAIRARHDDPESCADTVAMLAALDARDAEIRRLTAELQQARQQTAEDIARRIMCRHADGAPEPGTDGYEALGWRRGMVHAATIARGY